MNERTPTAEPSTSRNRFGERLVSALPGSPIGSLWRPILGFTTTVIAASVFATAVLRDDADVDPAERVDAVTELAEIGQTPVELPLEETERVLYWVQRYTTDERATFEYFLAREQVYGEMIRGKLRKRGMPEELLYLAMIESGLRARAVSNVAAVGVWQFMGPTARQYGLRIDGWVDERRDPIKATDAALDYLSWLHQRYGSWYLAAAAYNAGPTRVDRALRQASDTAGDLDIFWKIQHMLPRETREHVPRMIAATLLAQKATEYGFAAPKDAGPFVYDRVWVPGGTALHQVARAVRVENATMRALNPHLLRGMTPPGAAYALRVPVGSTHRVVASLGGGPWGSNLSDDD